MGGTVHSFLTFPQLIQVARNACGGWPQLATKTGVSEIRLRHWWSGRSAPDAEEQHCVQELLVEIVTQYADRHS